MLCHILSKGELMADPDDEDLKKLIKDPETSTTTSAESGPPSGKDIVKRATIMKEKVKSFARVHKMYATLRNESELILKLKGMAPDGKIPRGLLLEGRPAIRNGKNEI
jgi:serine/threonine-protein phosphatase 2B catalytic subunit